MRDPCKSVPFPFTPFVALTERAIVAIVVSRFGCFALGAQPQA
jgi:hypothetical protein